MYSTSTSRRRGKVKRRKFPVKPPEVFKNTSPTGSSLALYGSPYTPPPIELTWRQRHPMLVMSASMLASLVALVLLIYLIPKSSPPQYEETKKKQPTLSALDTSLERPGQRAAPTDASFLATPYRRDSGATGVPTTNRASGSYDQETRSGNGGNGKSARPLQYARYGDGTVTRENGNCQVRATGSGNFADALADCVNGSTR